VALSPHDEWPPASHRGSASAVSWKHSWTGLPCNVTFFVGDNQVSPLFTVLRSQDDEWPGAPMPAPWFGPDLGDGNFGLWTQSWYWELEMRRRPAPLPPTPTCQACETQLNFDRDFCTAMGMIATAGAGLGAGASVYAACIAAAWTSYNQCMRTCQR
jgi:hypothetical protein